MADMVEISSPPPSTELDELERDETCDPEELRDDLEECLTNIQSSGSFVVFEALMSPPNPGIFLKHGGVIGLPLSDRDAEAIVAASHQAPFGKGEETVVDISVRKTWEISGGDFVIRNPAWGPFLQSIVTKVSAGLGVDATGKGVSAQLYKMLLYDEGAMFKPHQDSEKAPHMFATLVIALPSKHEGGEVRLTHSGETRILETSKSSEFDSSFLAWFSDVTHEVKPVLSGRRLVLTYNLVHTTLGSKELAANSDKSLAKLRALFPRWNNNIDKDLLPSTLAYLFQHEYTDASLCYDGLKGHDQLVASHLRQVCEEFGFCFYLASLEKMVSGGCDDDYSDYAMGFHKIIDECDSEMSLTRVVDLDGTEVAENLEFDEELFIQNKPFEDSDPDEEDYSGFTGNEGVSATHFYRRTVAVIMPKRCRIEFLLTPDMEVKDDYYYSRPQKKVDETPKVLSWIDRLTKVMSQGPDKTGACEDLQQICKMVIRQMKAWKLKPKPKSLYSWQSNSPAPHSEEVMMRIVDLTLELDNMNLFLEAYYVCLDETHLSMFRSVAIALVRYDLQSLLQKLESQLSAVNSLSRRLAIIDELQLGLQEEPKFNTANTQVYQNWLKSEIDRALSSVAVVMESANDGTALVNLSKKLSSQEIFTKVLPAVKRNLFNTPMSMAFSTGLFDAGASGDISADIACTVFKDIVSDISDSFSLRQLSSSTDNKRVAMGQPYTWRPAGIASTIEPDHQNSRNLAALLSHCSSLQLESDLDKIITNLTTEATTVPVEFFETIYLPGLKALMPMLQATISSSHETVFRRLFQQLLATYVVCYVKDEPKHPQEWSRRPLSCTCSHCQAITPFLLNPVDKTYRMKGLVGNRKHVERGLPTIGFKCETDKRGSPQTLVITKTPDEYRNEHKAWKLRQNKVSKHLTDLGSNSLRVFLSDMYEPIMAVSVEKLTPFVQSFRSSSQHLPLGPSDNSANRILPPITKRKVPSEVIVIDD